MDSQCRFERAMRSLESTSQKIAELRATFKKCRSIVSVINAAIVQRSGDSIVSEIKIEDQLPLASVVETPMVQAMSVLSEIKMQEQVPVSILEPHIVGASGTKQEEQLSLVSVVEKTIVEITSDVLISEKKLGEHLSLVSTVKTSPGDANNSEIKQAEQLPTSYPTGTPTLQVTGDALISEAKAEELAVATPMSQKTRSEIDSRTCFDRAMKQRMVKIGAAFGTDLESPINEIMRKEKPSSISVAEAPTVKTTSEAFICGIKLEEQLPLVPILEEYVPVIGTPISLANSSAIDSKMRLDRATHIFSTPISGIRLEEQYPMASILATPTMHIIETELGEHVPTVSVLELHTASTLSNDIKLDEQLPLVSVLQSAIMQVIGDSLISETKPEEFPLLSTVQISTGDTLINEIKLLKQLPFASVVRTPNVQLSSILNSKARLEVQSPVVAFVETPPVQVTNPPIGEATLQERLFIILKNLPPSSQLPRFTAAEIKATAVRFEQAITSLVTLSIKIAETKAFLAASGRFRAASVVRHSPPQSPLSLRHSIFTHIDFDESECEDSVENDCSAPVGFDFHNSESESEHSDTEGVDSFPKFESKKARILREKREALAATLTDDMLFNLLLVDCTTKPKLPDKAPIIIRKRISRVPIDWEPKYIGKYRVQWW